MNTEFERMMHLAGLTEIKVNAPNIYNNLWQKYLSREEDGMYDEDGALELINSYKGQTIISLDDLANKIYDFDETLSDIMGTYPHEFFEELIWDLEKLCDEMNFSQKDELINKLKALNYGDDDDF